MPNACICVHALQICSSDLVLLTLPQYMHRVYLDTGHRISSKHDAKASDCTLPYVAAACSADLRPSVSASDSCLWQSANGRIAFDEPSKHQLDVIAHSAEQFTEEIKDTFREERELEMVQSAGHCSTFWIECGWFWRLGDCNIIRMRHLFSWRHKPTKIWQALLCLKNRMTFAYNEGCRARLRKTSS